MKTAAQLPEANYFGDCPKCGGNDGYVNIGRGHWFLCHKHKTMWYIGSNLFSNWREETLEEQEKRYYSLGLDSYEHVDPWVRYSEPEHSDDGLPF